VVFYIAGLYDQRNFRNTAQFYSGFFRTISVAGAVSVIFFYLIPIFGITPKTNLFIFIVIFTLLESANRYLFNNVAEKKFKKPMLIVGASPQAVELAKFITDNPQFGYDLKYLVNLNSGEIGQSNNFGEIPIIEGAAELEQIVTDAKINTIIIGPEAYQAPEIINVFYKSLEHKITFYSLASFYERLTGRVPLGAINQVWFLENLSEGNKRTYEMFKRLSDIIFATTIGAVSLVLYPFIVFTIKINSRGPIFYKQKRIGQIGKIFEILKFRTMRQDAEKTTGAIWAADNDPRVTRIGKFLRKTRIDELPQLWNILKGEMSLIGPRAERPEFHEILKKEIPFYEEH
ncbi:MAG: sugar transferase, partial [Candidatus Yanofskybacteria bacterium GW2011_GWA2_41_22]